MLKEKKAFLFDMDGTLIDSMWLWDKIDEDYFEGLGIELPADLKYTLDGMGLDEVAHYVRNRFNIEESAEEIQAQWIRMACDKYRYEVKLKPGARAFLDRALDKGYKMAVCTSNSLKLVEVILEAHELGRYFRAVITTADVSAGKPAPDVYLEAAKKLGVKPEDAVVFEDIVQGIMSGSNAGMMTVAVYDDYSAGFTEEKKRLSDMYIESFEDIVDAI